TLLSLGISISVWLFAKYEYVTVAVYGLIVKINIKITLEIAPGTTTTFQIEISKTFIS
ncbi:4024_t:CDS:1, partial [Entrophospora sp. SA101]